MCSAGRATAAARCSELIRDCHETPKPEEGAHRAAPGSCSARCSTARSSSSFPDGADRDGAVKLRVNVELQDDFSMDQTLSLYLLETLPLLDPQAAGLRARAAHAGRVHPRRPGHHPAQATRQGEGPEDGRDERRKASNTTSAWRSWRSSNIPKPNREISSTPPSTPLPTGIRGSARKTSARNPSPAKCSSTSAPSPTTSAIYELQRAEGVAAAASEQRFQSARADRPRRRQERRRARDGTLPRHDDPRRSIPACWMNGRRCATRFTSREMNGSSRGRQDPRWPNAISLAMPPGSPR